MWIKVKFNNILARSTIKHLLLKVVYLYKENYGIYLPQDKSHEKCLICAKDGRESLIVNVGYLYSTKQEQ